MGSNEKQLTVACTASSRKNQLEILRKIPSLHFTTKRIGIMHNSYNAASNFSTANGTSGFLGYLWKNMSSSQQQKSTQSSSSSWRQNNSSSGTNNNNNNNSSNNNKNSGNSGRKSG